MLAEVAAGQALVAELLDQQPQVAAHRPRRRRPRLAGPCSGRPAKASARSRNSHGLPRQPRPTTTPSHPVSASIRRASSAHHTSPLPSTGTLVTCGLELGDPAPVGGAGVELLGRPGVQRDGGRPAVDGRGGGVEERLVLRADADPHLHGDRDGAGAAGRGLDDPPDQPGPHGQGSTPAVPGHLGRRAAHVEVDVVHAELVDDLAHGLADEHRVDAVQLDAPDVLVRAEPGLLERVGVVLDQRARADHLADVEPRAVAAAQRAEGDVGDAGHRREHHGRVDLDRADAPGGCGAQDARRHRDVTSTSRSASRRRSRGSDSPTTLPWSPSIPSTNGPAVAVEGEGAGDGERLAGGDVGLDLGVGRRAEADQRGRDGADRAPGGGVDDAVPGGQRAGAAAHRVPAAGRLLGGVRLAERLPVEHEHRVAADDERALGSARRDGARLLDRQRLDQRERVVAPHRVLVEPADDDDGVEAGGAQQPEAGGRGGGQHQGTGHGRPVCRTRRPAAPGEHPLTAARRSRRRRRAGGRRCRPRPAGPCAAAPRPGSGPERHATTRRAGASAPRSTRARRTPSSSTSTWPSCGPRSATSASSPASTGRTRLLPARAGRVQGPEPPVAQPGRRRPAGRPARVRVGVVDGQHDGHARRGLPDAPGGVVRDDPQVVGLARHGRHRPLRPAEHGRRRRVVPRSQVRHAAGPPVPDAVRPRVVHWTS